MMPIKEGRCVAAKSRTSSAVLMMPHSDDSVKRTSRGHDPCMPSPLAVFGARAAEMIPAVGAARKAFGEPSSQEAHGVRMVDCKDPQHWPSCIGAPRALPYSSVNHACQRSHGELSDYRPLVYDNEYDNESMGLLVSLVECRNALKEHMSIC